MINQKILILLYLILIFLATPWNANIWVKIPFWLFSLFLVLSIGFNKKEGRDAKQFSDLWILIPLGIVILTRMILFIHYGEAPLGYDTGIYLKHFEDAFLEVKSSGVIKTIYPVSFITDILYFFGWRTSYLLSVFYILLNIFTGLGIYVVSREYFDRRAAFFSFFIFSISFSQFLFFWWFYWRMMFAILFTLVSFYLIEKKSWLLVPVAGFMGAVHPLSLLPFGLAMILKFIFSKDRKFLLFSGIGIVIVTFSVSFREIIGYFPYFINGHGFIQGYPDYLAQELTGQFVDFNIYRSFVLIYLPFAILGAVKFFKDRRFSYLFFYFCINFSIIYLNFIFHNRYIILFDLVAIILAGPVFSDFINKLSENRFGKIISTILILGSIASALFFVLKTEPLVKAEELKEIKSLSLKTEKNAYVMATSSYYSPWIYGYSGRKTIAPGLFEYDKWDLDKWRNFWFNSNLNLRYSLLNEYEKPLYIFTGEKSGQMDFSSDKAFSKISDKIWKYNGN